MRNKENKKEKVWIVVGLILAITVPFISAFLYCLRDGKSLLDVYIPLGGWSDEITYFRQIGGIVKYGFLRGYSGFNQSSASGGFGAWGPFPLYPYAVYGRIFGWGYLSPIFANITFVSIGFTSVFLISKPKKNSFIAFLLTYSFMPVVLRHIISGAAEGSYFMLMMPIAACGCYLFDAEESEKNKKKIRAAYIACLVLTFYLTLERGYYAVLFLIPFWNMIKKKNVKRAIITFVAGLVSIVLFAVVRMFFCAQYYGGVFGTDIKSGILGFFGKVVNIMKLIWYGIRYYGGTVNWSYIIWTLSLAAVFALFLIKLIKYKEIEEMSAILLITQIIVFSSFMVLYGNQGGRHLLGFALMNMVVLAIRADWKYFVIIFVFGLLSYKLMCNTGGEAIPYKNVEYAEWFDGIKEDFSEAIEITDGLSMRNMVAMPTYDYRNDGSGEVVCTHYGLMFALPEAMGMSLDEGVIYDDENNIKAGYILVHPEGMIKIKLEEYGYKKVLENDTFVLFKTF